MWDRPASSVLIVSKAAGDQKRKANSQKLGVKKIQQRKGLLFIEADLWDS